VKNVLDMSHEQTDASPVCASAEPHQLMPVEWQGRLPGRWRLRTGFLAALAGQGDGQAAAGKVDDGGRPGQPHRLPPSLNLNLFKAALWGLNLDREVALTSRCLDGALLLVEGDRDTAVGLLRREV